MAGQPTLFQRRVPGETNQPRGGDVPTAARGELKMTAGEMPPCSHRAWTSLRACPHSPSSGVTTTTKPIPGTKPIYTLDATHTTVEELRWRTTSVHLELSIWRPYEFSHQRNAERIQHAVPGTREWKLALAARASLRFRARKRSHTDPHAYFVEVHSTQAMPWFMGPVSDWFARFAHTAGRSKAQADGGTGHGHAGVGTPEDRLAKYFSVLFSA